MAHIQKTPATRNFPKGGWEARYRDNEGTHHARTFATKREAEQYVAKVTTDLQRGDWIDPQLGRTKFAQVAADWMATNPGRKEQTRQGYETLLNKHVLPFFGNMPVASITKTTVRQWIAERQGQGVGPGVLRNAYRNVLKQVMEIAVEQNLIRTNPVAGVKMPESDQQEMLFLTPDNVATLAEAVGRRYQPYGTLVYFAAYTGLRAGEIGALRVKHLDLLRKRVTVAESVGRVRGKGLVYGPTKTYSIRTVSLPGFLVPMMEDLLSGRESLSPDDLLFVSPQGQPIRHHHFYERVFKPAVRISLPPHLQALRFHDLRHTCASMMIALNANPKAVQQRLGHSSIKITYDRYGHLFNGWDEDLTQGLDNLYRAPAAEVTGLHNRYPNADLAGDSGG